MQTVILDARTAKQMCKHLGLREMLIHPQVKNDIVYRQVPSRYSDFACDPVQRRLLDMLKEDLKS